MVMKGKFPYRVERRKQYLYSLSAVIVISLFCYFLSFLHYRVVALVLLLTVSVIAISFDILPVLLAAVLSALIWNYFFIPPQFTFHVDNKEDTILFLTYFLISLVNAVLTFKIRQIEKIARRREERINTVKLYNTLLNSLSHELRTPIATIIAATDNLQSNNNSLDEEERMLLTREISKASFRLNEQVENLLNMSRLESGIIKPKKDWCDIAEIIYQSVQRVEEYGLSQQLNIEIAPELPLFKLDKGMMEQVIYNLLNNAVQYTDPNTIIWIKARMKSGLLLIQVEDNGKGFPDEEMEKVFEKFYRLKNSKAGGTGLGLSIVKGLIEAQDGTIQLKHRPGGGAQFDIRLPAKHMSLTQNLSNE